jgi:cytidine deaminase
MTPLSLKKLSDADRALVDRSLAARENAYAPYSRFKVGAVAVSSSGRLYPGCNVESSDYTLTTHAEMNAINAMVAAGETELAAVAVCLPAVTGLPVPCGLCRQKMKEFAGRKGVAILCVGLDRRDRVSTVFRTTLDELLPLAFSKDNLKKSSRRDH